MDVMFDAYFCVHTWCNGPNTMISPITILKGANAAGCRHRAELFVIFLAFEELSYGQEVMSCDDRGRPQCMMEYLIQR